MEFKDYYDTLGVKPEASDAELKSAYRRLARKYHPDVSKEAGAEDKFKAVNEAWEALKDPDRRKAYDQLRARGYHAGDEVQPPPNWQREAHFDFGEGGGEFSDFFESLFRREAAARASRPRKGRDLHAQLTVGLATAFAGGQERIVLRDPVQGERALDVRIPAGIQPGQQIRLAGQGHPGINGAPAGDLLLEIHLRPDPRFRLDGRDVLLTLPIAPWEAGLGAKVTVPTLAGEVELSIPPGSNSGRKLRLRGRGFPGHPPGDQIVILEVHVPKATTDAQRKVYEDLRGAFDFNPRGT
jgi:curved DNA-binding protein